MKNRTNAINRFQKRNLAKRSYRNTRRANKTRLFTTEQILSQIPTPALTLLNSYASRSNYHTIMQQVKAKPTGLRLSDPKTRAKTFLPFRQIYNSANGPAIRTTIK